MTSLIFALILFNFLGLLAGKDFEDGWAARQIYPENCAACHGFDRSGFIGAPLAPAELKTRGEAAVRSLIRHGIDGTLMPAQSCRLSFNKGKVHVYDNTVEFKGKRGRSINGKLLFYRTISSNGAQKAAPAEE